MTALRNFSPRRLALLLAFLWCAACTTARPATDDNAGHQAKSEVRLAAISLSDGVSRTDAEVLARHFFDYNLTIGCGMLGPARETPDTWTFVTLCGYGAIPGDEIIISKADGTLTHEEWRYVRDPKTRAALVLRE